MNNQTGSQVELMLVSQLLLDPENPRLASLALTDNPSQFDLLKVLWTEMAVDELVMSIAANGFFPEEPLFVVPVPAKETGSESPDKRLYYVLEGNRRLAAVRILLHDDLRQRLRISNMPVLDQQAKERLRKLPVSIYKDREELWAYLSFRHINAPQEWDAYSKARFVALVHEKYEVPLDQIASRIGDQHETVRRLYRGFKILRQAEEEGSFDVAERYRNKFYFSHLYTAMAYSQFQEFLGVTERDFDKPRPVPTSHKPQLAELLVWLYGKKSGGVEIEPKVRRQNPDLNHLREIISKPTALDALRSGLSLERSYEVSIGDERRLRQSLTRAKEEIQRAKAAVTTGYDGDEALLKLIDEILRIVETVQGEMHKISRQGK